MPSIQENRVDSPEGTAPEEKLPFKVAPLDQGTLLTVINLRVAPGWRVAKYAEDRLVLKLERAQTYLVVTPAQRRALERFGSGCTVPGVVFSLITNRECIPLHDFYELVIKACERGFLESDRHAAPPAKLPTEWRWKARGGAARFAAISGVLALVGVLLWRPLPVSVGFLDALVAWVAFGLALSAGNFLGACVVARGEAEVYSAGWRWRTPMPRFHADLWDAIMAGGATVVDSQLARLAAIFWIMVATAWLAPGSTCFLFLGALWLLSPLWRSPGWVVLRFLYRVPALDALLHFEFEPNREIRRFLRAFRTNADWSFYGLRAAHAVLWLALVMLAALLPLRATLPEIWSRYRAAGGIHFTAVVVEVGLILVALGAAGLMSYIVWLNARDWWGRRFPTPRFSPSSRARPGAAAIMDLLRQALLFRMFSDEERAAIAGVSEVESFRRRQVVVREGDPGDRLYLVYSGVAAVQRLSATGRLETIARLGPGEVFGEMALLNDSNRTRTVVMESGGLLVSIKREAFNRLVLSRLSRRDVETAVQKASFLYRIAMSRDWTPAAITAFSAYAVFKECQAGDIIIRTGQENLYFYLLYEGRLAVLKGGEVAAHLEAGDFFGEISILRGGLARATVKAAAPSRFLCVDRADFLKFVTRDFLIGLYFEDVGSRRLGEPLYQQSCGLSFEVHA